ncbi:MAG: hypothetical protein LBT30_07540 [Clostridiales bacterium]|jgi:hypothetical protein|nr:hypothetical protein [Clostridiales bacterium]
MNKKLSIFLSFSLLFISLFALSACYKNYNPTYVLTGNYGGYSASGVGFGHIKKFNIYENNITHTKLFNYTYQEEKNNEQLEYTVLYGFWEIERIIDTPYSKHETAKMWYLTIKVIYDNRQTNPNTEYTTLAIIRIEHDNPYKQNEWWYVCSFEGEGLSKEQ